MKLLLDLICFKKGRTPSLMCHLMAIISMILEKHSNVEENWHFLDVSQYYFKPAFFYHCRSQFHQRFSYEILGAKISNSKHSFVIFGAKISYKKRTHKTLMKLTPGYTFSIFGGLCKYLKNLNPRITKPTFNGCICEISHLYFWYHK